MMKKNVNFLILFLFMLFTGNAMYAQEKKHPKYIKYVNEITRQFATEMKQEHGFLCIGSGGSMPYDVEGIDIKFVIYKKATIEDARELIIMITRRLQKIINTHKKIRPYLREYPFGTNRIIISISFYKKNNSYYKNERKYIAYASHIRDLIYYDKYDLKTDEVIDFYNEPYEDAEKIVDNKNTQKENNQI